MLQHLSTIKQILIKSARLSVILTIVNVALSLVVSKAFSGSLGPDQVTGSFGNITLLEAMLLLLYGGAVDLTSSVKWASAFKFLRLPIGRIHSRPGEEEEGSSDARGGDKDKTARDRRLESDIERSRGGERRAISYVLSGTILLAETVVLAMLSV